MIAGHLPNCDGVISRPPAVCRYRWTLFHILAQEAPKERSPHQLSTPGPVELEKGGWVITSLLVT